MDVLVCGYLRKTIEWGWVGRTDVECERIFGCSQGEGCSQGMGKVSGRKVGK